MNVIPPVPTGSSVGPRVQDEDAVSIRRGVEIEDLTPPMRSDDADTGPAVNEPRLIAQAADTARSAMLKEMGEIDKVIQSLTKRVEEIETALSQSARTDLQPPSAAQPTQEQAIPAVPDIGPVQERSGQNLAINEPDQTPRYVEAGSLPFQLPEVDPDAKQATYRAPQHSIAEEVREIEFRRPIEDVKSGPEPAASAGLSVAGTPGLYKGIFLRGWGKASAESEWEMMDVEDEIVVDVESWKTEAQVASTPYPWTNVLRPTWDYARMGAT